MKCTSCDTANPDDREFCEKCGEPLKGDKHTPVMLPVEPVSSVAEPVTSDVQQEEEDLSSVTDKLKPLAQPISMAEEPHSDIEEVPMQIVSNPAVGSEQKLADVQAISESAIQQEPTVIRARSDVLLPNPIVTVEPPSDITQPKDAFLPGMAQSPISSQVPPVYSDTPYYGGYSAPSGTYPSAPSYPGYPQDRPSVSGIQYPITPIPFTDPTGQYATSGYPYPPTKGNKKNRISKRVWYTPNKNSLEGKHGTDGRSEGVVDRNSEGP